jgi:DNA-binding GntR family transcriptional regulator
MIGEAHEVEDELDAGLQLGPEFSLAKLWKPLTSFLTRPGGRPVPQDRPAKAAVERLVHDGLLRRVANKTARVPVLGLDEVRDLYFSRGLIERSAMQALAGRGTVAESAREALDRFDAAAAKSDLPQVVESDIAFHRALVDSLGSPRLSRLYVSLMGEFHLCMAQVQLHELLDPKTIAAEHAAIVAAVEAGDPARAVAEIDAHLHNAGKRIVAFYEND